jgi:hypothetical protein
MGYIKNPLLRKMNQYVTLQEVRHVTEETMKTISRVTRENEVLKDDVKRLRTERTQVQVEAR